MHKQTFESELVDIKLETALNEVARTLFNFADSQNDSKKLHGLDEICRAFELIVADYHNRTGRLHPDLSYDLGEWITLKAEMLEAKEKGNEVNLPVSLDVYRGKVKEMIK